MNAQKIRILSFAFIVITTTASVRANMPMSHTTSPVTTSVANESTVMHSQAKNTLEQQSKLNSAVEWGLSEQEWVRYENIKKGARGIWSPNLDPLTTLGIEATNEAERMKYARLLARKEFERVEKELRFQLAYDAAFKELYPHVKPIRDDKEKLNKTSVNAQTGRVLFFTRINDCPKCETVLNQLLAKNQEMDIYLIDSESNDDKIRDWAVNHRIDVNKVRNRQITLNHDNGFWLFNANGKIPAIFKITPEGEWLPVSY